MARHVQQEQRRRVRSIRMRSSSGGAQELGVEEDQWRGQSVVAVRCRPGMAHTSSAAGGSWGTEMAASVSQGVLSLWPYMRCAFFLFYLIIRGGPYYQPTPQIVLCNRL